MYFSKKHKEFFNKFKDLLDEYEVAVMSENDVVVFNIGSPEECEYNIGWMVESLNVKNFIENNEWENK